ncbi:MAG: VOC family protein [Acidimicrobiales bacterium]
MPEFTSYAPGTPSWVDLMSPDVGASEAFYQAVFGWEADEIHDDEGNRIYVNFRRNGKAVAGLSGQEAGMEGMPAVWNTYVSTDDLDAAVARVGAAGGTVIMPPMEIMDAGAMAVAADPSGAVISLWSPANHIGAEVCNEPNTFGWNELLSRDLEAAKAFYHEVFGWDYATQDMGPGGEYTVIEGGDNGGLGGMMAMPAEMPEQVPDHWMVYFIVDDLDATVERVTSAGGQVPMPANDVPGVGRITVIHDPQGGAFSLMEPAASDT